MGLSKKLGVVAPKAVAPPSTSVPYKWSNQTYTIADILAKFKLPCVVQCATDSCTVVWSEFQFDLRQPLLLYDKRTIQKMHAVCLNPDPKNGNTLEEIGPALAIPKDYEGWFGACPKGVDKVKRHNRIESVANSTTRRFVVTTKCPAFTSSRASNGDLVYVSHDVSPGEVLKRVCVMDPNPGEPGCPRIVRENGPCLECLDEKDEDVIIPLSHRCVTYEVAEMYPDDEERAFQISAPIEGGNSKLPRILSLLHGEPPLLAYAFTSVLRCYSVFTEETILAATLDDPKSMCLELGTDSVTRFRLALNEAAVKKTVEYNNANQMCVTFGSKFWQGIKVSFSLSPDASDLDDIDLSLYESTSDMQEVEATSEFEIAWGSERRAKQLASHAYNGVREVSEEDDGEMKEIKDTELTTSFSNLPKHRDFTEQEIADLMKRKGMAVETDTDHKNVPPVAEVEELKENRVTDNPLYYFFQRNPDQAPPKSFGDRSVESSNEELAQNDEQSKNENPFSHLFDLPGNEDTTVKSATGIEPSEQTHTDSSHSINDDVENDLGAEEIEYDITQYNQATLTPAKEFSEDDGDGSDSTDQSDENSDEEDIFINFDDIVGHHDVANPEVEEESARQPVEANVIVKASPKRQAKPNSYLSLDAGDEAVTSFRSSNLGSQSSSGAAAAHESPTLPLRFSGTKNTATVNADAALIITADATVQSADGSPKAQRKQSTTDQAVDRLNSLINEVTAIVDSSRDVIKDITPTKSKRASPDLTKPPDQPNEELPLAQRMSPAVAITRMEKDWTSDMATFDPDGITSIQHDGVFPEIVETPDKEKSGKGPKSLPRKKKSKGDNSSAFVTGLADSKKSKSDDFIGALRRTSVEENLVEATKSEKVTSSPMTMSASNVHKLSPTLLSRWNPSKETKREQNRFASDKVTHHPHEHPHKVNPAEAEDMDTAELPISPNKRGKVLASVQNFERLASPTSSINDKIDNPPGAGNSENHKMNNAAKSSNAKTPISKDTSTHPNAFNDKHLVSNKNNRTNDTTDFNASSKELLAMWKLGKGQKNKRPTIIPSSSSTSPFGNFSKSPSVSETSLPPQDTTAASSSSEEEVVTIEEHFNVSTGGEKLGRLGKNGKAPNFVFQRHHFDGDDENFV